MSSSVFRVVGTLCVVWEGGVAPESSHPAFLLQGGGRRWDRPTGTLSRMPRCHFINISAKPLRLLARLCRKQVWKVRLGLEAASEASSSSSNLDAATQEPHAAAETGRAVLGGPRMSSPKPPLGALTSRSAGALGWLSRLWVLGPHVPVSAEASRGPRHHHLEAPR